MNAKTFNRRTLLRQIAKRNRKVINHSEQQFDDELESFLNAIDAEVQANIDRDIDRFATAATDAYNDIFTDLDEKQSVSESELSDVSQAIMAGMERLLDDINA